MNRIIIIVIFLLYAFLGVSAQGQYEHARNAYNTGKYEEAKRILLPLANKGDTNSQVLLAYCYEKLEDMNQCVYWHQKAAEKNKAESAYALGQIYDNNTFDAVGITKNVSLAKKYYQQAKLHGAGTIFATYATGNMFSIMYDEGEKEKAKELLLDEIKKTNDGFLMRLLGVLYDKEKDGKYNAMKWFRRAAEKEDSYALYKVGVNYMNDNPQEAIKWFEKAAVSGDNSWWIGRSMRYLGFSYMDLYNKDLNEKDLKNAIMWFYSNKDDAFCDDQLSKIYKDGLYHASEYKTYSEWEQKVLSKISTVSDVDREIPNNDGVNDKTFVLVIANEKYEYETNVPFAENDGAVFAKYCKLALNIPNDNIHVLANATGNKMKYELDWLAQKTIAQGGAKIILYYSGHGVPSDDLKSSCLLPTDGYAKDINTGINLVDVYKKLGSTSANVVILLDACFSGANRSEGMLVQARGVAIKAKDVQPQGKMVVLSACQGTEKAFPYEDQKHGLFTYYLLKKLQLSRGNCNLSDLYNYIRSQVNSTSMSINQLSQNPSVAKSVTLGEQWKTLSLR